MDRLEKIDILRERTGLGYAEANKLLDEAGGDVVAALIEFEKGEREKGDHNPADKIGKWVKEMVAKGNVTRLRVRRDDRVLLEIPVTAGVVGAIIAPELAVISAAACLFTNCTLELERSDGAREVHALNGNH